MVTRLAAGDTVVAEAEAALEDGQGSRATDLLREAKSLYREAQVGVLLERMEPLEKSRSTPFMDVHRKYFVVHHETRQLVRILLA